MTDRGGAGQPDHWVRRGLDASDVTHLDFLTRVILPRARARGLLPEGQEGAWTTFLQDLRAEAGVGATPQAPDGLPLSPPESYWSTYGAAVQRGTQWSQPLPAQAQASASWSSTPSPASTPSATTSADGESPGAVPAGAVPPSTVPVDPRPQSTATYWQRTTPTEPGPVTPGQAGQAARPAPRPATRLMQWWSRTRARLGSDLAVHGLAYLGVLLFFVGAFGLVAFAFGDVSPNLRPVAEAVIAAAPFAAGAVLRRRKADVVGRALELAGGLILPVMLVTAFVDGVAVPPDLTGTALVLMLTGLCAAVSFGYAAWSRRHPASALRYLVAPIAWLAVAMATLGVGRDLPVGKGVATPSVAQIAFMALALAASALWARLRPEAQLAAPTLIAAVPGLLVLAVLAPLAWVARPGPSSYAVLLTGVSLLVGLECLHRRVPAALPGILEPLWWAVVWLALMAGSGGLAGGAGSLLVAAGFLGILELAEARRRPVPSRALAAGGLALALLATWIEPAWAAGAFSAATGWAVWRRRRPYATPRAPGLHDVAAALLPIGAVVALTAATTLATGVLAGAVLVLLVSVPARRGWLDRTPGEPYWTLWWAGGTSLVALLALSTWADALRLGAPRTGAPDTGVLGTGGASQTGSLWSVAIAFGVLALAAGLGPIQRQWRPGVVVVLASAAWLATSQTLGLAPLARVSTLAIAGLALVAVAHLASAVAQRPDAAGIGLAGHLVGTAAVALALPTRWPLVVVTGLATVAWGITAWRDSQGRSVIGSAIRQVGEVSAGGGGHGWSGDHGQADGRQAVKPFGPAEAVGSVLGWVPYGLTAAGLPATVSLLLDRSGVLALDNLWAVAVLAGTAVLYAGGARLRVQDRVGAATSWASFAAGLAASLAAWAGATEELAPATPSHGVPLGASLAALTLAVIVLPAERRTQVMIWVAWLAPAPAVGLFARAAWPWLGDQPLGAAAAVTLVAVGSVLLVGAAGADLRGRAWAPRLQPSQDWAWPPVIIGAAEVAGALVLAASVTAGPVAGAVLLTAATAVLAAAVLSRVGALSGVSALVAWWAVVRIAGASLETRPWLAALTSLGLLLAAEAFSRTSPHARWWTRWDVPLLIAAGPVAGTGVALAGVGPVANLTLVAIGAECLAVAVRLRRQAAVALTLGAVGAGLALGGAALAGSGWLALTLFVLAVVLTVLGATTEGPARLGFQVGGVVAALAAWRTAINWLDWPDHVSVEVSALASAAVAVLFAGAVRRSNLDRGWVLAWGGGSVALAIASGLDSAAGTALLVPGATASWIVVGALLAVAAAVSAAADPTGLNWLREVAALFVVGSLLVAQRVVELPPAALVTTLCLAGAAAAVILLALLGDRFAPWRRPVLVVGAALLGWAVIVAVLSPVPSLLSAPLAVAAVQAAAAGVALHRPQLSLLSPALACAAWIVFALESLQAHSVWVIAPIGLAILATVVLWRQDRQRRGEPLATPEVVGLELVGVALLVGPSLVRSVTDTSAHAGVAIALGLAVAGWGLASQVRRRLAAGLAVLLVAVLLLVAVPLAMLLPTWEGPALWAAIAGVGLAAVAVAAMVERGKVVARQGLVRFTEATLGWE